MQVELDRNDLIRLLQSIDGNCFIKDNQESFVTDLEKLQSKHRIEIYEITSTTNGYYLDYEWCINEPNFIHMHDEELFKLYKKYKSLK